MNILTKPFYLVCSFMLWLGHFTVFTPFIRDSLNENINSFIYLAKFLGYFSVTLYVECLLITLLTAPIILIYWVAE